MSRFVLEMIDTRCFNSSNSEIQERAFQTFLYTPLTSSVACVSASLERSDLILFFICLVNGSVKISMLYLPIKLLNLKIELPAFHMLSPLPISSSSSSSTEVRSSPSSDRSMSSIKVMATNQFFFPRNLPKDETELFISVLLVPPTFSEISFYSDGVKFHNLPLMTSSKIVSVR